MTLRNFTLIVRDAMSNASVSENESFEDAMISGKVAYSSLSTYERSKAQKVCDKLDEREVAFLDYVNSGLNQDKYKLEWSKTYDGWSKYKDCEDGDLYLTNPQTKENLAYIDLKCSTMDGRNDYYNPRTGWHLGGMINQSSLRFFSSPNHFYILSTFDGNVILAIDSVSLRNKIKQAELANPNFKPLPSKYKSGPYYTVYHHIRFICNLNDDVFILRNKNNVPITCFNYTMDDYDRFIQNKSK